MPGPGTDDLSELSTRELLDLLASEQRVPAGGTSAAFVVAIAPGATALTRMRGANSSARPRVSIPSAAFAAA